MTDTMLHPHTPSGLPDPHMQPGFYQGVTTKRFLAWLVDMALILTLAVLFSIFTFFIGFFVFPLVVLTISLVYRIGTLATGSATLGMRFFGIEIRNHAGYRLNGSEAALHTVLYHLSIIFFLPQIVSWAMMIFSDKGQGLHDAFMGTAAINRPR